MDTALREERDAIASARRGDSAAFGTLVERYQEVAFRTSYLIVRDAPAAEDVAQEAFIRAYRSLSSFRESEPFRPWLLRIVTNLSLNEVRARARRFRLFERTRVLAEPPITPPSTEIESRDEASEVLRAINELPLEDRVVLYLRYFVELPEREIAEAIGKAPGTVKSRLHRASGRLRELIETKYPHLRESFGE